MSEGNPAEFRLESDTPQFRHDLFAIQVDLKPGIRSGLAEAEHALEGIEDIAFQRFSQADTIRQPVVGRIVEAYERYRA